MLASYPPTLVDLIILIMADEDKVYNFCYATSVSILFPLPFQLFKPLY